MGNPTKKRVRSGSQKDTGQEIIYGRQVIREYLKKGKAIKLFIAEDSKGSAVDDIRIAARAKNIATEVLTRNQFALLVDEAEGNQGVAALVPAFQYISLHDLMIKGSKGLAEEHPLFLMLDHIEDPRNLGSVIRTACAAKLQGIIIPKNRAAHVTPSVRKAAAGLVESIPMAMVSNLVQALKALKKAGFWVYGIEASGDVNYYTVDYKLPLVIVAGSEGKGLTRLVRDSCDRILSIPMPGESSSLNVSVATALVIYEALSQREKWIR